MLTGVLSLSRRVVSGLTLLLIVSIVVFGALRMLPADPLGMMLPPNATREDAEAMRRALGFDRSIGEQYAIWLGNAVSADLGTSIQSRLPVTELILKALPMTVELVICGLFLGLALGLGMGLASFYWRGGVFERIAEVINHLAQSIPEFLWAILLILGLGIGLALLPFIGPIASHMTVPQTTGFLLIDTLIAGRPDAFLSRVGHLVLPSIALSMTKAPLIMRVLRSSLLDAYANEYVAAARLRGVGEMRILFVHALRNAALPTLSLVGVQASHMFGGTLLIEAIYGLPGIGSLMIGAVRTHDLPLIQGLAVTYCAAVLALNGLVDLAYRWLDPRLRAQ